MIKNTKTLTANKGKWGCKGPPPSPRPLLTILSIHRSGALPLCSCVPIMTTRQHLPTMHC